MSYDETCQYSTMEDRSDDPSHLERTQIKHTCNAIFSKETVLKLLLLINDFEKIKIYFAVNKIVFNISVHRRTIQRRGWGVGGGGETQSPPLNRTHMYAYVEH